MFSAFKSRRTESGPVEPATPRTAATPAATLARDAFGFETPMSVRQRRKFALRASVSRAHWDALRSRNGDVAGATAAECAPLVNKHGIEPSMRAHFWLQWLHVPAGGARGSAYTEAARAGERLDPCILRQIDVDVPRTFSEHAVFAGGTGAGCDSLRRVLRVRALRARACVPSCLVHLIHTRRCIHWHAGTVRDAPTSSP